MAVAKLMEGVVAVKIEDFEPKEGKFLNYPPFLLFQGEKHQELEASKKFDSPLEVLLFY